VAELGQLFDHIRAWHRYEPNDWLGNYWDELNEKQRLAEYRKAHAAEHERPLDYFEAADWLKLEHSADLLSSTSPDEAQTVPML
jgi:hypothetical protein